MLWRRCRWHWVSDWFGIVRVRLLRELGIGMGFRSNWLLIRGMTPQQVWNALGVQGSGERSVHPQPSFLVRSTRTVRIWLSRTAPRRPSNTPGILRDCL